MGASLLSGRTQSCGCLRAAMARSVLVVARAELMARRRRGERPSLAKGSGKEAPARTSAKESPATGSAKKPPAKAKRPGKKAAAAVRTRRKTR